MKAMKDRLAGANKGHGLLKRKAEALKIRFRVILLKIIEVWVDCIILKVTFAFCWSFHLHMSFPFCLVLMCMTFCSYVFFYYVVPFPCCWAFTYITSFILCYSLDCFSHCTFMFPCVYACCLSVTSMLFDSFIYRPCLNVYFVPLLPRSHNVSKSFIPFRQKRKWAKY